MSAKREGATDPIIALVVAKAENGAIGRGGDLPWHLRSDMRYFRSITLGKPRAKEATSLPTFRQS